MTAPLLVTDDPDLLDELLRLAAAAGVQPELARDPAAALPGWRRAPLVLVGPELAEPLASLGPGRRDRVFIAALGRCEDATFPVALALGAEGLVDVTASAAWVVETFGEVTEPSGDPAVTIGVIGGSGGVGASVFAAALGLRAARRDPVLLVDCDAHGPGLDRMLGLELVDGVRWDALHQTTGRISGRALRESVPHRGDLGVLTWHSTSPASLQPFAAREVLAAARRGHGLVVLDLPRGGDRLVDELVARTDAMVLLVAPTVVGVASATRTAERLGARPVHLVVRGGALAPGQLRALTGAASVTEMSAQRGLDEAIDVGAGPLRARRGPLARAATEVLGRLP